MNNSQPTLFLLPSDRNRMSPRKRPTRPNVPETSASRKASTRSRVSIHFAWSYAWNSSGWCPYGRVQRYWRFQWRQNCIHPSENGTGNKRTRRALLYYKQKAQIDRELRLTTWQQDCYVRIYFIMKTDPWTCFKKGFFILRLKERALYFVLEKNVVKNYNSTIMNETHSWGTSFSLLRNSHKKGVTLAKKWPCTRTWKECIP